MLYIYCYYPTEPSSEISSSFCASTANSIGSLLSTSLLKPLTMSAIAFSVIAGREDYEVTDGSVELFGKNLLELSPEERAGEGVFLAFQYPVEIPGLTTTNFVKTAVK